MLQQTKQDRLSLVGPGQNFYFIMSQDIGEEYYVEKS